MPSAGQVVVSLLLSSGQEFPFKAPWHGTHAIATLIQMFLMVIICILRVREALLLDKKQNKTKHILPSFYSLPQDKMFFLHPAKTDTLLDLSCYM